MIKRDQHRTLIVEALSEQVSQRIVSFDVPGHKQGKGNPLLREFLGDKAIQYDLNSRKPLDYLCSPTGVILEAEKIAAEAFGAGHAFFIVGGTTAAVQTMVMSACKQGDKIILPRNVHRSAINALILTGAIPVYVNPGIDEKLGIGLGMSKADIEAAILANPDVKAVFVNNPTYYGICGDLKGIVEIAHRYGVKVLVDEAHGTHFYFGDDLPISAMAAGADMAAVSMHKTGGSLTQSSFLLIKDDRQTSYVRSMLNLTHTTSGSYLLLASLDIARKHLALEGRAVFKKVAELTRYAREEIRKVSGYIPFDEALINGDTICNVDPTKLSVFTRDIGLTGIEIADILRDEYDIQIEFGDLGNILAIISVGDTALKVERLLGALTDIKRKYAKDPAGMLTQEYIQPIVVKTPREAFYTPCVTVSIDDAIGRVSGESIMAYPPGIPICAPGEYITKEIVDMIHYAKSKGSFITGPKDTSIQTIDVLED